jgi:hypothetical protein
MFYTHTKQLAELEHTELWKCDVMRAVARGIEFMCSVKVKTTAIPIHTMEVFGGEVELLLILDLGAIWGLSGQLQALPPYPQGNGPSTHCI